MKICGLTRAEDVACAAAAGADMVGFVFARSRRRVSIEQAESLVKHVPGGVLKVGVFVNEDPRVVEETASRCRLDLLQFHGEESPAYCARFAPRVIKAFRVRTPRDLEAVQGYTCSFFLFDAFDPRVRGGAGRVFDHRLLLDLDVPARCILAGGLTPENVGEAIRTVHPWGVDVSSGVESSPGVKDHARVRDFIRVAKETA